MAAPHHASGTHAVSSDTLITIKISVNDVAKRLKLPLRDLGISVLPDRLRQILDIKPHQHVVFERYSDSASGYITLDENNPQVFKTLIRAAKAKLKLRLKATVTPVAQPEAAAEEEKKEVEEPQPQQNEDEKTEVKSVETPVAPPSVTARDSTAFGQRSIGSGIFQFREALASQQTLVNDRRAVINEQSTSKREVPIRDLVAELSVTADDHQPERLAFRTRAPIEPVSNFGHAWSVYCNECDKSMSDAHYHCSICDGGDYDLCEECVANGKLCPGEGHWLIKRFIKDGKVIHSTTERISPRLPAEPKETPSTRAPMPGAFTAETKTLTAEPVLTRTCNNCVVVLPEREFVTCTRCEDFDVCLRCHAADEHGHHPAHTFAKATKETVLTLAAEAKLAPGRNMRHNAICDGCDQKIYGVRHKCLNCPDWDYCSECVKNAPRTHRGHRFAALYEPITDMMPTVVHHYGIYCDGPLCNKKANQQYIHGVRYKCAICNDTDFCAACEALPDNAHNRTHPLIKFKTPVRNVNVSTENEDVRGNVRVMGDRRPVSAAVQTRNASTEAMPARQVNAATQVHTVAEIKPTEVKKEEAAVAAVVPLGQVPALPSVVKPVAEKPAVSDELNAHFVRDSVADGTSIATGTAFAQVWTMKNPGPLTWPAGCSVRFVGGDNMLNVDNNHPAPVTAITQATESNIVGRPVSPGEEVAFKVVLKAPTREGKSISYWRLKAPDGSAFGHRLWCDIDVVNNIVQAPVEQPPPPRAGASATAHPCASRAAQLLAQRQQIAAIHHDLSSKSVEAMSEEERRALFQQRMARLRAEVVKNRASDIQTQLAEMRATMSQAAMVDPQAKVPELQATMAAFTRSRQTKMTDESEKVKKIIAEVSKDAEAEQEKQEAKSLEGSQMVFPKLDKESPASSTYQSIHSSSTKGKAAYVENEDGEVEHSAVPVPAPFPVPSSETEESDEDLEVLSANEDEPEDDGFLTDEEYDILDASDHETVASLK